MPRRFLAGVATIAVATGALILTSCSTPQTRISEHLGLYQSLSRRDQTLVSQGQIRIGMSRTAVWLAWGSPDRKIVSNIGRGPTETWIYVYYATYPYYRPWDPYFGAPLYDPFWYDSFPPSIPYPAKAVTFAKGRVVSFHYVASHCTRLKILSRSGT
jgi:outer membrane protein assembly factor BamE (lipoprotein component of BamABCDE complex)